MKHTLLRKKKRVGSNSRLKLGFSSRAGLSTTKMKEIPEVKKETLAELKEDDEDSNNTSQVSVESAASRG